MKTKSIDGPVNTAFLDGTINGVTKSITMFMDIHVSPDEQTNCETFDSITITQFFKNVFRKSNNGKPIDILYEGYPLEFELKQNIGARYIDEVCNMFRTTITSLNNDGIGIPFNYKNIRIHMIDIRLNIDYYLQDNISELDNLGEQFVSNMMDIKFIEHVNNTVDNSISSILELKNLFVQELKNKSSVKYFKENKKITHPENLKPQELKNLISNLIIKIVNGYTNSDNKKKINMLINKYLIPSIDELLNIFTNFKQEIGELLHKFNEESKNNDSKYRIKTGKNLNITYYGTTFKKYRIKKASVIYQKINDIYNSWEHILTLIMDMYLLRRIIDNDKITNIITYTGIAHSSNYIYFLVKYFSFNISDISYSKYNSVSKLTELVKKANNYYEIRDLIFPELLQQCSIIKNLH